MEQETLESFNKWLFAYHIVVAVFEVEWCAPCQMLKPIVAELRQEYGLCIPFIEFDVEIDGNGSTAHEYSIHSLPTTIIFRNQKEFKRIVGVQLKCVFQEILDDLQSEIIKQPLQLSLEQLGVLNRPLPASWFSGIIDDTEKQKPKLTRWPRLIDMDFGDF